MRKIFTLLLLTLLLPAVALAEGKPAKLVVGGTDVKAGGYWTMGQDGKLTSTTDTENYNVHYDKDSNTLTLNNATISGSGNSNSLTDNFNAAIYAAAAGNQSVSLTIVLKDKNTVEAPIGIFVNSTGSGTATLTITSNNDGTLEASYSDKGIWVNSNYGNASLNIRNATVTAEYTNNIYGYGIDLRAGGNAKASLTVIGGQLTATGNGENGAGIRYTFGGGTSGSGAPSLTVSGNAIVKANNSNGGGIVTNSSTTTTVRPTFGGENGGIVFDKGTGTVYLDVTLPSDLTIGKGESLKLGTGASLDANGHHVIVDGGTLDESLAESLGESVIYKVTKVELDKDNLTLDVGDEETLIPTITPDNATDQNVTWSSDNQDVAMVDTNGKVTAVGEGSTTITATVDGKSATCSVTVNKATPTIQVTVPSDAVYDGKAKTATATVKDINGETLNETVAIAYYTTTDRTDANKVDNPTDAGTYYVTATFAGNDDYVEVTDKNSSFTIGKAKPTINLIVPTGEDLIYNGQAKAATATVIGVEGETLDTPTITYYMDAGMTTAAASTIDIGTYYVKAVYAESTNYESVEKIGTFTVTTANITITRPEEQEGTITLEPGSVSFTLIATISGLPEGERNGTWNWVSNEPDVARVTPITTDIISTAQVTPVSEGTATITVTYTSKNYTGTLTYAISVKEKEEPEPPVIPDYPDYYNIYVDECEGVTVETSTNVVREGNSMTFTVDVEEGYTGENMTVKVKRSLFGYSDIIKPNEDGIYEVKNIYTEIYITVDGVEEVEEPTGIGDVESTKVYAKDGSIYVQTPQLETVTIISISGEVRKQEELIGLQRYDLPRGIYIICIGEERIKVRN